MKCVQLTKNCCYYIIKNCRSFPRWASQLPGPDRLLSMKRLLVKHSHHLRERGGGRGEGGSAYNDTHDEFEAM